MGTPEPSKDNTTELQWEPPVEQDQPEQPAAVPVAPAVPMKPAGVARHSENIDYYRHNPERFAELQRALTAQEGDSDRLRREFQLELTKRDLVLEHADVLTKDDITLLSGDTPDALRANAEKLASRLRTGRQAAPMAQVPTGTVQPQPPGTVAAGTVNPQPVKLPTYETREQLPTEPEALNALLGKMGPLPIHRPGGG